MNLFNRAMYYSVLFLGLLNPLWAGQVFAQNKSELQIYLPEAKWETGTVVVKGNITLDNNLIPGYRKFLGMTPDGYYLVQDFYKQDNKKYTSPYMITNETAVAQFYTNLIEFEDNRAPIAGAYITWWQNGRKQTQQNYLNGKAEGISIFWYVNGQKGEEGQYKNGKPVGTWSRWESDGSLRKTQTY